MNKITIYCTYKASLSPLPLRYWINWPTTFDIFGELVLYERLLGNLNTFLFIDLLSFIISLYKPRFYKVS